MRKLLTRFAPSPTGSLHLGHLLHVAWVWHTAKTLDAAICIRIEDHDRVRSKPEFEDAIFEDLLWLNLIDSKNQKVLRQSDRSDRYLAVASGLIRAKLVYACRCSRKDLERYYDPISNEVRYPGICRDLNIPLDTPNVSWRVKLPDLTYKAHDLKWGPIEQNPSLACGDLIIKDRQNYWTYQFCVVVDDLDQSINLVVRGEDLLSSIGRQLALRSLITSDSSKIEFLHHPLFFDHQNEKLSKSKQSPSLKSYRDQGVSIAELLEMVKTLLPVDFDSSVFKP